jgi:integrase
MVNKMMRQLRSRVPGLPKELSAHVPRHTWNDDFSDAMDKKGVPGDQEAKWRAKLMGWRRKESAEAYLRRTVRRRSNQVLVEMQHKLDIQHATGMPNR